jgi:hypothetical protein
VAAIDPLSQVKVGAVTPECSAATQTRVETAPELPLVGVGRAVIIENTVRVEEVALNSVALFQHVKVPPLLAASTVIAYSAIVFPPSYLSDDGVSSLEPS